MREPTQEVKLLLTTFKMGIAKIAVQSVLPQPLFIHKACLE